MLYKGPSREATLVKQENLRDYETISEYKCTSGSRMWPLRDDLSLGLMVFFPPVKRYLICFRSGISHMLISSLTRLGCIETEFCIQVLGGKLSARSTQCTPFYNSPISRASHCAALEGSEVVDEGRSPMRADAEPALTSLRSRMK